MIEAAAYAITVVMDSLLPRQQPVTKTQDLQAAASIRDIRQSVATFMLQGAMLSQSPTASVQCFEQYLKLQTEMLIDDLTQALRPYMPTKAESINTFDK